jgi:Type IV secretion system pilin
MWQFLTHAVVAQVDIGPLPQVSASASKLQSILSIVFVTTGAIAVLIITIAGFRYVVSRGDPNAVAGAKNAIIYAVVGLIISIAAFSIVTFVVNGL